MDTQQRIELAEQNYLAAVSIIRNLCKIGSSPKNFKAAYTNTLWYFEAALQGVLLYAAVETNKMPKEASAFISNFTMTGNVINTINDVGARRLFRRWQKISWDKLFPDNMAMDEYKEIIKEAIISSVRSFIFPLIQTDSDLSSRSFSDDLSSYVKNIIKLVFAADTSSSPELTLEEKIQIVEQSINAIDAGFTIFNESFLLYWKNSVKLEKLNS